MNTNRQEFMKRRFEISPVILSAVIIISAVLGYGTRSMMETTAEVEKEGRGSDQPICRAGSLSLVGVRIGEYSR